MTLTTEAEKIVNKAKCYFNHPEESAKKIKISHHKARPEKSIRLGCRREY
jgi:hypothetical protein